MKFQKTRNDEKDVKEWPARGKSVPSGRNRHVPQVTFDRQQAIARKLKEPLRIATRNIRSLLRKGKLDNIKQEMERSKINILGLSEVRWKGAGETTTGKSKFYYSGGEDHERGVGIILDEGASKSVKGYWAVSDRVLLLKVAGKPLDLNIIQVYAPTSASSEEDAENFYEEIEKAKTQCKNQDPLIIMGDFNAKVGQRGDELSVGMHGTGNRNERGERLVEWCEMNNFTIGNTCFQQPQRRKWTWKSPGDSTRNQIDYILISGRFKNALLSAKSYPGADCYSDHALVLAKLDSS